VNRLSTKNFEEKKPLKNINYLPKIKKMHECDLLKFKEIIDDHA